MKARTDEMIHPSRSDLVLIDSRNPREEYLRDSQEAKNARRIRRMR
jgi:hypothetical protein